MNNYGAAVCPSGARGDLYLTEMSAERAPSILHSSFFMLYF